MSLGHRLQEFPIKQSLALPFFFVMASFFLAAAWFISTGCDNAPPTTLVLDGVGFRWKKRPHRINKIGVEIEKFFPLSAGVLGKSRHTLEGGSWAAGEEATDCADLALDYTAFSSVHMKFTHASTPLLKLESVYPNKPATVEETVSLSLDTLGLSGWTQYAVLLRGFDLDTDLTHTDGYTIRRLGVRIQEVNVSGDLLTFKATLKIQAGAVPDRVQKLSPYGATGKIHYTVMGVSNGGLTPASHAYTLKYLAGVNPTQPHAGVSKQQVIIQGISSAPLATVAWTGFEFTLNPSAAAFPGRYMRELGIRNRKFKYDPTGGKMAFQCDGYFSNSGSLSYALENKFQAHLLLIQVSDPDGHVVHQSSTSQQKDLHTYGGLDVQY